MAKTYLGMKMAIYKEREGTVSHIPENGGLRVQVIGLAGLVGFADGLEIDNTMAIGDGIRMMITNETIEIKRVTDAYSIDIYDAFSRKSTIDIILNFGAYEGGKIELTSLRIPIAKVSEFRPHQKPLSAKLVKPAAASNGYELIRLKFSAGETEVKYYNSLEIVYTIFMQTVSDRIQGLVSSP